MKLPTDEEIIEAYKAAPTSETVKKLCAECHSESRPIRVLCEAGLMGYKVVPSWKLPRCNRTEQEGVHKKATHIWTSAEVERVKAMRKDGMPPREIAAATNLTSAQIRGLLSRRKTEKPEKTHKYTDSVIEKAFSLRGEGKSYAEIGKAMGLGLMQTRYILENLGKEYV